MANKKELKPTNVRPIFKSFIKKRKGEVEEVTGKFTSEYYILMSYLKESSKFVEDFNKYCDGRQTTEEDLLSLLTRQ